MTDVQLPPTLVVWGDFNCPWCALVSLRMDGLRTDGRLEVDWRAVQHRPDLPTEGEAPDPGLVAAFDEVVTAASPGERPAFRLPRRLPNTAAPTRRFAVFGPWARPAARGRLFEALWRDDLDIGSTAVLELIQLPDTPGAEGPDPQAQARRWQQEWEELGVPVPVVRTGDGALWVGGRACLDLLDKLR